MSQPIYVNGALVTYNTATGTIAHTAGTGNGAYAIAVYAEYLG